MLCCICYRHPATIFRGRAGYCSECDDVKPFLAKTAEEDAKDAEETAKLEAWREKQRKKKEKKSNG